MERRETTAWVRDRRKVPLQKEKAARRPQPEAELTGSKVLIWPQTLSGFESVYRSFSRARLLNLWNKTRWYCCHWARKPTFFGLQLIGIRVCICS